MIKIIDGLCGVGKSTRMFEKINKDKKNRYLLVTPYRDEIDIRIPKEMPDANFYTPQPCKEGRISQLPKLLEKGVNIACTHVLYSNFTPEIVDLIVEKDYILVIDEVLDSVGMLPKDFNDSDTEALLVGEFVLEDKENRGKLSWNHEKYPDHIGRYSRIKGMCDMGMLFCYREKFLMWELPPKLLSQLKEIWILTYLFEGSDMRCWLDINKIPYEYIDNEAFGLLPNSVIKERVKENLEFIDNRNLNRIRQKDTSLSSSWYSKANGETLKKYKTMMTSTVKSSGAKSGDVFWTTFKSYQNRMRGVGYCGKKGELPSFLPCNARATNEYKDRWLCMYGINKFKNPIEVDYLEERGVDVKQDIYSLSEMIQFIFRGSIRQGKPMKIFVLSKRMRTLLENWLNE